MYVELVGCEDEVADLSGYKWLGFANEGFEVVEIDVGTHDDEVQFFRVEAAGKVADEVDFFGPAEVDDHAFDDAVDAGIFAHEAVDVGEERVFFVGLKHLAVAFGVGFEEAGFFEAVELEAYGIGAVAEFSFETTQIACGAGVQEELQHELDAGAGSD